MSGPLYKKFTGGAINPLNTLTKSQQAVGSSLKEALNSVQDMMNTQEQNYKDENTLNMQAYMQDRLKSDGLSAEPLDDVAIRERFGKRIDMKQVKDTYNTEMSQMKDEATNTANDLALTAFDETEDITKAGEVFRKSLASANMKSSDIDKAESQFRDTNKFRVDDIQHAKEVQLSKFDGKILEGINAGMEESELMAMVDELPIEMRVDGLKKVREDFELKSKLSPDKLAEYQHGVEASLSQRDANLSLIDETLAQAKQTYDNYEVVPASSAAAAKQFNMQFGGLSDAVDKATDATWYKDIGNAILHPFDNNIKKDDVAGRFIGSKVKELIDQRGVDPEMASAIVYQAINDTWESGKEEFGKGINSKALNSQILTYLDRNDKKQEALATYNTEQKKAIKKRQKVNATHSDYAYRNKRKFRSQQRRDEKLNITQDMEQGLQGLYNLKAATTATPVVKAKNPPPNKGGGTTVDDVITGASKDQGNETTINLNSNKDAEAVNDTATAEANLSDAAKQASSYKGRGSNSFIAPSPKKLKNNASALAKWWDSVTPSGKEQAIGLQKEKMKDMSQNEKAEFIKKLIKDGRVPKDITAALIAQLTAKKQH